MAAENQRAARGSRGHAAQGVLRGRVTWHLLVQIAWGGLMLVLSVKQIIRLFSPGISPWTMASILGLTLGWALVALAIWVGELVLFSPHGLRGPLGTGS